MNTLLKGAAHHAVRRSRLSPARGWALMKDRNVSMPIKAFSIAVGMGLTGLLVLLEVPLEAVLAAAAPLFGLFADVAVDGLEIILAPALLACCALSLLVKPQS